MTRESFPCIGGPLDGEQCEFRGDATRRFVERHKQDWGAFDPASSRTGIDLSQAAATIHTYELRETPGTGWAWHWIDPNPKHKDAP